MPSNICPTCKDALEKKFQEIKAYIREHKGVTIAEISKEFEISQQQIRDWVKEGRLEFAHGVSGLTCRSCGTPIDIGTYCSVCQRGLISGLRSAADTLKPKEELPNTKQTKSSPQMRFLDKQ